MVKFGHHRNDSCRICGGRDLDAYLDLGEHPPSNAFLHQDEIGDEERFPLVVYLCKTSTVTGQSIVIDGGIHFQ